MSGQIFISYRREDSSAWAGRLYDRLHDRFPQNEMFMDVDNLPPGIDFVEALEKSMGGCDVQVVVIGKHWLIARDEKRRRRLSNPEDFVRLEIATALRRGIGVIPVLVDGASMPRSGDLPEDLKSLVRRQALAISHDRFRTDAERLIGAVERALEDARVEKQRKREEQERKEKQRLEVEARQKEEKDRLEAVPQSQLPSPVAPSTPPVQREPDKPPPETPKVVHPLPPAPSGSGRVKPPPASSRGIGGKSPSKQVIAFLAIAAVLVLAGLIYLAIRASQSSSTQPAPIAAVTASPPAILDDATKEHPWVNSLGMKFAPVAGTQVLFSIWDTRVQDFEAFVADTNYGATGDMQSLGKDGWKQRGATWKEPGFSQGPTHPVVGVSWNDAKKFCEWLTRREQGSGMLPRGWAYRLPTDAEWSAGVGLQGEEGTNPKDKDGNIKLYPWGKEWPPPEGAGNYAGKEAQTGDWPSEWPVIKGYNDGYPRTSPVGSFAASANGLYDMGGNVWQWCEDWYDATETSRVLRGASWSDFNRGRLLASFRDHYIPDIRFDDIGFRCVVGAESSR